MIRGVWGKKIGMTQVFKNNRVYPVTVIDTANWLVTAVKNKARDGYAAVAVGRLRKRYEGETFSSDWLKDVKKYFQCVREITHDSAIPEGIAVGQSAAQLAALEEGKMVDATGVTIGHGFAGVMKRHGFSGGVESHGSMFHRRPGTMSFMRSRGRVIKGKRLPGHMGCDRQVMKNLEIIKIEPELVLVKGSVPGKAGSMVYLRKAE